MTETVATSKNTSLHVPGFLLIHPDHAQDFLQYNTAEGMSKLESMSKISDAIAPRSNLFNFDYCESKPYPFADGVAVIPVSGNLIHRSTASWRYYTGYDAIRNMLTAALEDPDVRSVVFDCNSPGGHVSGAFELSDFIYKQRGKKPMVSVVDASAYSACYAIASSAGRIIVTPTGGVGSIGVISTHVDISGAMEKWGEKVTFIYAGSHKIDGNPYQKLSKAAQEAMQARVDGFYNDFVTLVARNRGIDESAVRATEAACYSASDAVSIGLADAVMTSQDALAAIVSELSGSSIQEDYNMTDVTKPAATATQPAVTTAPAATAVPVVTQPAATATVEDTAKVVTSERDRISAILAMPEAKGRETMAQHIALKTGMDVAAAKEMLLASPASANTQSNTAFIAAMGADGKPVVQPGSQEEAAGGETVDKSAEIMKDFQAATGFKFNQPANAASVKH